MKNNKILFTLLTVMTLTGLILLSSCGKTDKQTDTKSTDNKTTDVKVVTDGKYFCPMHPTQQANEPGRCPICKMNMVAKDEYNREINEKRNGTIKK
jgi:hypothetical protein